MSNKMTIEETINGLQEMIESTQFIENHYDGVVDKNVCKHAIELLKKREPKPMIEIEDDDLYAWSPEDVNYYCPECEKGIFRNYHFCPYCGQAVRRK